MDNEYQQRYNNFVKWFDENVRVSENYEHLVVKDKAFVVPSYKVCRDYDPNTGELSILNVPIYDEIGIGESFEKQIAHYQKLIRYYDKLNDYIVELIQSQ